MRHIPGSLAALLIFLMAGTALGQERTIRGQVTDSVTLEPISNPSVSIVGTDVGTIGESDGSFELEGVPAGEQTLLVQRIGFRSAEVPVPAGQSRVDVQLATDYLRLEELVVTGRATDIRRQNLATAVSTVSGEELSETPVSTVDEALQGKVAGANIVRNSGAPGGGLQVRFRGGSSIFASTQPLYVVDGVIVSNEAIPSALNVLTLSAGGTSASTQDDAVNRIADLNPEDIESIEILKGATAAAQYGSKASNGVVVITTTRGSAGDTRVQIDQRLGFSDLSNKLESRPWTEQGARTIFGDGLVDEHFQEGRVFDNEEALAGRNDLNHETSASVSGGDEQTQYFASGLWKSDEGIIANTGYDKQSARLNLNQSLGERWNLDVSTNIVHSNAARGVTNNDNSQVSYYMVLQGTPSFFDLRSGAEDAFPVNPFIGNGSNPLQTAALTENEEDVWRGNVAANLGWGAVRTDRHTVDFRGTFGVDAFNQENELFAPPTLHFEDADGLPGTSLLGESDNVNLNANANAVWEYSLDDYSLTTSAGLQFERTELNVARIFAKNLTAGQRNVDAGNNTSIEELKEETEDFGVYVQEDFLGMDERLFLSGSVRFDQSSSNGDPEELFIFPSLQASYRFPELGSVVQEVKVRGAFGQSGNQPRFGQKFTSLSATNNIEGIPGVIPGLDAGDPGIEPEKTTEIEGGVDLILVDGRARLEATAYRQEITDLILQRSLAPSKGINTQFFNGGELRSEGVELSLRASPFTGSGFGWSTVANFSANRTEVTSLPVPAFSMPSGFGVGADPRIEEGESLTQLAGPDGTNPDGSTRIAKLGDSEPDFTLSFSNDFALGGLRLHSLLDWRHGQDVVNLTELLYDASLNSVDYLGDSEDLRPVRQCGDDCSGAERLGLLITPAGDVIEGEGFVQGFHGGYVQSGSFMKLRELSLSYTLPGSALEALPAAFGSVRLAVTGRNLLTVTPYEGLDPEVSNFGNQPAGRNIDVAPYPPSRSWWFSVSASF